MTTSSVIRFNVTKTNDNTSIICSTKNEATEFESRASILLNVKYSPVVSIKSEPKEMNEGDAVKFTCSAKSNPGVKSYLWFENNIPLIGSQTDTYEIESISRDHHKVKIKCQVRNLEGKVGSKTKRPSVNYSPVFTKTPTDVSDDKDAKVKLPCKADGYPNPNYIWYRNGDIGLVVGDKSTLEVKISSDTIGKYYCRVSVRGFSEISTSATVFMKGKVKKLNGLYFLSNTYFFPLLYSNLLFYCNFPLYLSFLSFPFLSSPSK